VERKLLEKLGSHRWLNLEDYRCPKFDKLISDSSLSTLVVDFLPSEKYRCNRHSIRTNRFHHCPELEVSIFCCMVVSTE